MKKYWNVYNQHNGNLLSANKCNILIIWVGKSRKKILNRLNMFSSFTIYNPTTSSLWKVLHNWPWSIFHQLWECCLTLIELFRLLNVPEFSFKLEDQGIRFVFVQVYYVSSIGHEHIIVWSPLRYGFPNGERNKIIYVYVSQVGISA